MGKLGIMGILFPTFPEFPIPMVWDVGKSEKERKQWWLIARPDWMWLRGGDDGWDRHEMSL